jgi:hypothetical protein
LDAAITIQNMGSHNARAAQCRRFIATPPKRAAMLRLVTVEDPCQTLGEWDIGQTKGNGSLALEVSALIEEHAQTIQRHTEGILGWVTSEGRSCGSKRLRARYVPPPPEDGEDEDQLANEALGITGNTIGQVIQMQRHLEVMTRSNHTYTAGLMQTALQLNAQLQAQLSDAYGTIHALQQQQIDAAAAVAEELQMPPPPETPPDDPSAQAKLEAVQMLKGLFEKYGPGAMAIAMAKWGGVPAAIQVAPANTNAQAPAAQAPAAPPPVAGAPPPPPPPPAPPAAPRARRAPPPPQGRRSR